MRNFKNNLRKNKYRTGPDRGFQRNSSPKLNGDFVHNDNFRRKNPGKNNHNASKLIEKYNDLAREALSKGDKILSENYFQHAEHFTRIVNDKMKNSYDSIKEIKTEEKHENKQEVSKQENI